jgi:hypothetical protein
VGGQLLKDQIDVEAQRGDVVNDVHTRTITIIIIIMITS